MDIFSIALGAGGVGLAWFVKLAGGKALPALLAWIRARRGAGKPDLESLRVDIVDAHRRIGSFDTVVKSGFASVYAEIDEIKARLGLPIAADAPAPTSPGSQQVQL